MISSDIALWLSALMNAGFSGALAIYFCHRVNIHVATEAEAKAKALYSWLCVGAGLFSCFGVFLGLVALLKLPVGQGEVLIAAPLLNLSLTGVLIIAGRIIIGWAPIKW